MEDFFVWTRLTLTQQEILNGNLLRRTVQKNTLPEESTVLKLTRGTVELTNPAGLGVLRDG